MKLSWNYSCCFVRSREKWQAVAYKFTWASMWFFTTLIYIYIYTLYLYSISRMYIQTYILFSKLTHQHLKMPLNDMFHSKPHGTFTCRLTLTCWHWQVVWLFFDKMGALMTTVPKGSCQMWWLVIRLMEDIRISTWHGSCAIFHQYFKCIKHTYINKFMILQYSVYIHMCRIPSIKSSTVLSSNLLWISNLK